MTTIKELLRKALWFTENIGTNAVDPDTYRRNIRMLRHYAKTYPNKDYSTNSGIILIRLLKTLGFED